MYVALGQREGSVGRELSQSKFAGSRMIILIYLCVSALASTLACLSVCLSRPVLTKTVSLVAVILVLGCHADTSLHPLLQITSQFGMHGCSSPSPGTPV